MTRRAVLAAGLFTTLTLVLPPLGCDDDGAGGVGGATSSGSGGTGAGGSTSSGSGGSGGTTSSGGGGGGGPRLTASTPSR